MRFTITEDAIRRLKLDPERASREFDGFPTTEGLLGGVPRGVLKWTKRQLKVERTEEIDAADARLAYYLLAIRNEDHTLLPFDRIDELALADFALVRHHPRTLDQDGDCGECNHALEHPVHNVPGEDPDDDAGLVPAPRPTVATGGPEIGGTVTP